MGGGGNHRRIGSLQFEQILKDFLLGAGNQVPVAKSAAVQESELFEPLLSSAMTLEGFEPEPQPEPFLSSITEGLVEPSSAGNELTISLDTAMSDVLQEISDDKLALRSLNFSLPEEEGMKYYAGIIQIKALEIIKLQKFVKCF